MSISAIPEVAQIEVAPTNQWAARVVRNAQNNTFQITVSAVESLQPRLVTDELRLRLLDTSGQQLAVAPLRLEGELVADVLPDPRALYLAASRAGEVIRDEFRVRSLTRRTFRVQRFECPKGMSFRALRPSDFSSDHRVAIEVETAVVNPPSGTAVLTIEHEDGTTSEVPVPFRVSGADANPLK